MNHIEIRSAVNFVWPTLHSWIQLPISAGILTGIRFNCQIEMQMTKRDILVIADCGTNKSLRSDFRNQKANRRSSITKDYPRLARTRSHVWPVTSR